jgi:hypothetical protein
MWSTRNIWRRGGREEFPFRVPKPAVPIVSDAAIGTEAVSDGRFIPLVILDTRIRPDIAELIKIQEKVPPGDVISAWGSLLDGPKDHIALFLHVQRPIELTFALNFDLSKQGSVVELALRARAIYLQPGKPGDRLYKTLDAPRMIAEIGAEMPHGRWDQLWSGALKRKLRAQGLRNNEARKAAEQFIEQMRSQFKDPYRFGSRIFFDPKEDTTDNTGAARQSFNNKNE